MVSSTIPTSTWSHNCGMHVIADFLVEKLQQDDFREIFRGKAYDELLKSFQDIYEQKELTWETIRESSFKRNRTDAQVVWGYALRMMMPSVIEQNTEYKEDLFNSFVAAMSLYKEGKLEELQITYPIIFSANEDYFKAEALNYNVNLDKYLNYWNDKGFKDYSATLITISEKSGSFLWLSKEELSIFCKYFNFEFEFVDHANEVELDSRKLYFSNPSQTHWERKSANAYIKDINPPAVNSDFYEHFLKNGSEDFVKQPKKLGELFFSVLYSDIKLGLALFEHIQDDNIRKSLITKDIKTLTDCAKNNAKNQKQLEAIFEFSIVYFEYKELIDLLMSPEINSIFPAFHSTILLGSVKYQKQDIFNRLLNTFPVTYDSSVFIPALILAAKFNNDAAVNRLLAHSDFDQDDFISKALFYVKPAFAHVLNQHDENNIPALYYAIKNKNITLTKKLLEKGACATYKVNGRNAFEWALDTSTLDMIDLFINTVSSSQLLSLYNNEGNNCFHLCFKNRSLGGHLNKWIEIYLNYDHHNTFKEIFNSTNAIGQNALHLSAVIGYLEGIEYCLENQVSLISQDAAGNTAFHLAAAHGQFELVKNLVEKLDQHNKLCFTRFETFDLDQKNTFGLTALNLAYKAEHHDIVEYLKSQGCVDIFQDALDELTKNFLSPAFDIKAFVTKHKQVALLADANRNTLMHYVCGKYDNIGWAQKLIRELILVKANIQAKNKQGLTPLHVPAKVNHVQAISELLEQGAFIDFITPTGLSACHIAAMHDNKEAFILLKDKGASLSLEAYPKAAEKLVYNLWDGKCPLTPIKLAEYHPDKNVYNYLTENQLIPKPEIDYKSTSHWLLNKTESVLGMDNHYFSSVLAETYELEKTTTYKVYSSSKILIGPICKIPFGLGAVGIEATKQALLYGYPIAAGQTDRFYYYLKPVFHNYTSSTVSTGFDYLSMAGSALVYSPFTAMNVFDLAENAGRRTLGLGASIGLLKLAQLFKIKNKEIQALAYIAGKELGFALADSYHETSPDKKAYKTATQNNLNSTLNHSYEIWTSLLGKTKGEQLVYTANYIHECQMAFYENIGDIEHRWMDELPECNSFKETLSSASEFFLGNKPGAYISENTIVSNIDYYLTLFVTNRDSLLFAIEKAIAENVFSDSDYQQLVLSHLHKMQTIIYAQQVEEAKAKLKLAEESGQTELASQLINDIAKLEQSMVEANTLAKTFYEKTPKGKKSAEYYTLKKQAFNSEYEKHFLYSLHEFNSDAIVDMAKEALGEDYTLHEMILYFESILNSQGVEIESKELDAFKADLNLDNLKPCFEKFCKKQLSKNILNKTDTTNEKCKQDCLSLQNIETEFRESASPEELRVLEISNNPEFKTKRFNDITIDRQAINHDLAVKKVMYFDFIESITEKEQAENNHSQLEAQYEETKVVCQEAIVRITETQEKERKEYNAYQDKLDFSAVFKMINEKIKDGTEGKKARKAAVNIMMNVLVNTGLISRTVAERQYRHDFYESLKHPTDKLESEIKIVFERASNEILEPRKIKLDAADKYIDNCNLQMDQAKESVKSAKFVLNQKISQVQTVEEKILLKLKPEQYSDFKEFSTSIKENMAILYQFNKAINEQELIEVNIDTVLDTKENAISILEDKQFELEKLNSFDYTDAEIWTIVKKVFDEPDSIYREKIYTNIFKCLVEKGLPNDLGLMARLFDNKDPKDDLKKTITRVHKNLMQGLNELKQGYIDEQKIIMLNDIENLKNKIQHLTQNQKDCEESFQTAESKVESCKADYFKKLTSEEQSRFQEILDRVALEKTENSKIQDSSDVVLTQLYINHQNAVKSWNNPAHVIGTIVNEGFNLHTEGQKLAEYLADEMIKLHQLLYPHIQDLSSVKMDRESLIETISNHKLNGYQRNAHRTKKRLYDFIFARISHTKEKTHHHRWERASKPFLNELSAEMIGYKPFKDFHGGEDKSGRPGIQFNYNQNGANNIQFVSSERPVATLYHSSPNVAVQTATTEMLNNIRIQEITNQQSEKHLAEVAERNFNILNQNSIDTTLNSVLQNTILGARQQSMPGPLRAENLSAEIKNPTSTQIFIPIGYQNTNKQPVSMPLPPEQSFRLIPAASVQGHQNNGNMINGWQNTQHAPNTNSEQPLGFLPGYSKLMHPETNQGASSEHQQQPVPIIPLVLPVVAPRRKEDGESSHYSASLQTGSRTKPLPSAATLSKTYLPSKPSTLATNTQKPSATPYLLSKEQQNIVGESLIRKQGLAQEYIFACGGRDPLIANACINTAYHALAQQNPYLLFPMATSGASAIVGKALAAAMFPAGLNHDATVSIKQLTNGNQLIFKDLFPLLKTYQDEGFEGIIKNKNYLLEQYPYSYKEVINAFQQQKELDKKADQFSKNLGLDRNDIRAVTQFFSDASNREMALGILMDFVTHEQIRVQGMYTDEFVKIIKDPLNIMVAKALDYHRLLMEKNSASLH